MDKKLFAKLIDSMKEMNEVAAGKRKPSRTFQMDADSVKVLRAKSGSANPNVANRLARQRRF
jgi:putative transcriptional regulator